MTIASNLGFPPLGAARELKRATEGYWAGKLPAQQLLATGAELRRRHWELQRAIGIDRIPANDFSFYDRMLDTCALVGAVPPRYGWKGNEGDLDPSFAMARGVRACLPGTVQTRWEDSAPDCDVFRGTGRQHGDRAGAAGARSPRGPRTCTETTRSPAVRMAKGSNAFSRRD